MRVRLMYFIFTLLASLSSNSKILGSLIVTENSPTAAGPNTQLKPRAVVHIGPHKTGSTHVQSVLSTYAGDMAAEGFYYPQQHSGEYFGVKTAAEFGHFLKSAHAMSNESASAGIASSMEHFLQSSAQLDRSVIFSIENLCVLTRPQIMKLQQLLVGFDVTIVATYREWIARFRSHYAGISLNADMHTAPFLHLIFLEAGMQKFFLNRIVANYASVFGLENIVIIDYYGAAAARKDIAHVILCEVAGILCNHTALFNDGHASRENTARSWLPRQLLDVFKAHVDANEGCQLSSDAEWDLLRRFRDDLSVMERRVGRKPPHQSVRLDPLIPQSMSFDSTLRTRYASRILYGDESANHAAMRANEVQELLHWRIYDDPFWGDWLHDQFSSAKSQGRVINCKY